jgi:aspartate dehydrogenase
MLRVAIAGFGAIGLKVAQALDAGIPGCTLAAIAVRDRNSAEPRLATLKRAVPIVDIAELEPLADLVVECAPAALLSAIATPFLAAGKRVILLSVGALLTQPQLIDLAREQGGRLIVPSGALLGLDAVSAAAEGTIHAVRMITRKPPASLAGAPYLSAHGIDIADLASPLRIFEGSAREAATGFPANLNVAAALALAGIGPDRTRIEIWADPTLARNVHRIEVEAEAASFSMMIENVPSENPKTGRLTALSVISCLRRMAAPLRIGG